MSEKKKIHIIFIYFDPHSYLFFTYLLIYFIIEDKVFDHIVPIYDEKTKRKKDCIGIEILSYFQLLNPILVVE